MSFNDLISVFTVGTFASALLIFIIFLLIRKKR